jgi:hypothetical protein
MNLWWGLSIPLFDNRVYFSKWVEYVPMVSKDIIDPNDPKDPRDYSHGTAVSSIIVDGHNINLILMMAVEDLELSILE